jgi:hypothetical protein
MDGFHRNSNCNIALARGEIYLLCSGLHVAGTGAGSTFTLNASSEAWSPP